MIQLDTIHHADCLDILRSLPDASIDLICTDPPYGYLAHRLDASFDAPAVWGECARVLKPTGGLITFGRGVHLARWMCILDDLGLVHKEEIVWYKRNTSSPCHPLGRNHEMCHLFGGPKFRARKSMIPYEEVTTEITPSVGKRINALTKAVREGVAGDLYHSHYIRPCRTRNDNITQQPGLQNRLRAAGDVKACVDGVRERSVMDVTPGSRHTSIHPTQKPVRLFERLIAIASDPRDLVLDPFSGSGSCALAALRTGRRYIAVEIDEEYHRRSVERLRQEAPALLPLRQP